MRIGLHALGIGPGARPAVIEAVAVSAEAAGFATLWSGEHIVMVDRPTSLYPYSPDGEIAIPPDTDWLDPLGTLTFAAAVTSRIRLATGVLLLAEHHPVMLAKRAATVDVLSKGRLVLGVGVGWSAEEFAALDVPFTARGRRVQDYLNAMQTLWRDDVSSYSGEFVQFDSLRSYPKPVRHRFIPVVLGGNTDGALERVARCADGWYGFNLTVEEVADRVEMLATCCSRHGRDPFSVEVNVALRGGSPHDTSRLEDLGVNELVLVDMPPEDPDQVAPWIDRLARHWGA